MNAEFIFSPMMGQISDVWSGLNGLLLLIVAALGVALAIGIAAGFVFLIHFLFTLPMRRAEHARLFLDLLEDALNRGQSAEEMILSLAKGCDPRPARAFICSRRTLKMDCALATRSKKCRAFCRPKFRPCSLPGKISATFAGFCRPAVKFSKNGRLAFAAPSIT